MQDRLTPRKIFVTCVDAHSLHHRLTCVYLLPQGLSPCWTHHPDTHTLAGAFLFLLLSKALMLIGVAT